MLTDGVRLIHNRATPDGGVGPECGIMTQTNLLTTWLGIPAAEQPADFYRLLGVQRFESDPEEIKRASLVRRQQLEQHVSGKGRDAARRLWSKLKSAKQCLLDPARKAAYDEQLRKTLQLSVEELSALSSDDDFPSLEELPLVNVVAAPVDAAEHEVEGEPDPVSQPANPAEATGQSLHCETNSIRPRSWVAWSAGIAAALLVGVAVGGGIVWWSGRPVTPSVPRPASTAGNRSAPVPPPAVRPPEPAGVPQTPAETVSAPATAPALAAEPIAPAPPTAGAVVEPAKPSTEPAQPIAATSAPAELEKAPETTDEPDEPEDLASLLATSATPPPAPQCRTPEEQQQYIAHVTAMLEAGLGKVRQWDEADARYAAAKKLCDTDPRLYYGYALIIHTTRRDAAIEQLRLAASQGAYAYPPAWQLHSRLEASKGISPQFVAGLVTFARRLDKSAGAWPDDTSKAEFAAFLGQVIGFCQGPGGASKLANELQQADREIRAALPELSQQTYVLGKEQVAMRASELGLAAAEFEAKQATSQEQAQQVADRNVQVGQQALDVANEKLDRRKEDLDKDWEQTKAQFEREWKDLQLQAEALHRNMQSVRAQIEIIANVIESVIGEIARLRSQMGENASTRDPRYGLIEGLKSQMGRKEVERGILKAILMDLDRKAGNVRFAAEAKLVQIAKLEVQYQRATGRLVKESDLIAGKRELLAVQKNRETRRKSPQVSAGVSSADQRRLSTYVPLDLAAERRRIVDSYGP